MDNLLNIGFSKYLIVTTPIITPVMVLNTQITSISLTFETVLNGEKKLITPTTNTNKIILKKLIIAYFTLY